MAVTQLKLTGVAGPVSTVGSKSTTTPPETTVPPVIETDIGLAGPWTRPSITFIPGEDSSEIDYVSEGSFILKYNGVSVNLRHPQLNDTQTLQSTVLNRRSRGGKKNVYRSLQWYTLHIYNYTFNNIREDIKDDLVSLLNNALADPIEVRDHLNNVYTDMYITEVGPVTEVHDDGCSYSIDLTMQVVK